jgi:VIT1/CCC1 family predicted Fe2+/Mn2+ transporter
MDETALKRIREVVFGVQDGLISNVALATSMAVATEDIKAILIAGLTGAIAGTFSMASGAFLASRA